MANSNLNDELLYAESLMAGGQFEAAQQKLSDLAEDAEEYVADNCHTTEDT